MEPNPREPLPPSAPLPSFALLSADGGPYRTLVEALDYGVLLYSAAGAVIVHNASAERVLGLGATQIMGRAPLPPGWALFYEDGSPAENPARLVLSALQTGQALRDLVVRVAHGGGHTSWLQATAQPLFTEAGEAYAVVASLVDVSMQRRAREQLERYDRFRTRLSTLVAASLQDDLGVTFYQRLMEGAVDAIPGAQAGSLLLRGDDELFYFVAAVNFDQAVLARTYLNEDELYRDPSVPGPQLIYGFDNSSILEPERRAPLYEAGDTGGIKVSLSIPVEVSGQVVAYFNLDNFDTPDAFVADTTEMGQLFAQQAAVLWRRFKLEAELRQERSALEQMAFFDPLTGLPNRTLLGDRLRQVLLQGARASAPVALIFLDLDNFKKVNDTLGHDVGDALLSAVAARLNACVRAGDTVARWGGDEFVVLLPQVTGPEDAAEVARKILGSLRAPFFLAGRTVHTGASLGASIFPDPAADADDLIKHADTALYRVKAEGKGGFAFFSDRTSGLQGHPALGTELRQALAWGALELRYTPRMGLASGALTGFAVEAFWSDPRRGPVAPSVLGAPDLAAPFYEQVLRLVCEQLAVWPRGVGAAVSVPVGLIHSGFTKTLLRTLELHRLEARRLELSLCGEAPGADGLSALGRLRAAGVGFSLPGFGGPNAPFGPLRGVPLQRLGLDASVTADLTEAGGPVSEGLVQAAVLLGRRLGARVFAEGLGTAEQKRVLERLGCAEAQGPFFGAALSAAAAGERLRAARLEGPLRAEP